MTCRHCGRTVPLLRRLSDAEFCSPEHRRLFTEMQQHLAFARLLEAQQRLSALPKVPLTPRPAPASLLDTLIETPRLANTVSLWPAVQSPTQISLRSAGPEWPSRVLALPVAVLALTREWMHLAEEADEQELFHDPTVWARLAAMPPIEPYFGEFLEPVAESEAMPAGTLQLLALSRAIQRAGLTVTGHIESLPGFLELYLSFLRVAEVDPPEFRLIVPEAVPLVPAALTSRPLYNFQSIAPSPAVQVEPEPEPVEAETLAVAEVLAPPEAVAPAEIAVVSADQLAPEREDLAVVAPVEALPATPVVASVPQPNSPSGHDPLRLEFAQPARRPVFASVSAEPLKVRYEARRTAVPLPRPTPDPLELDLSLAGATPAVERPALANFGPGRRVPPAKALTVQIPPSAQGGSQHRLLSQLEWASLTPFAPLEIVLLSPHEPGGDEPYDEFVVEHLYPSAELSAASREDSHRTDLLPLSFSTFRQGAVQDPGARRIEAASSPAIVSPALGSEVPFPLGQQLVPARLAAPPSDSRQPLDAALQPHSLEPAALCVPGDNSLPPWQPDLGCGLLLAHAVSMPVRILARQNKV